MNKIFFCSFFLVFFLSYTIHSQEHFPGGVPGAEAWYIVNHEETAFSSYPNHAGYFKFIPCTENSITNFLFNFNHSVRASKLCISYDAPLEINTSHNVFFVSEPVEPAANNSHLTTSWRSGLVFDTIANPVNRFDVSNQRAYTNTKKVSYSSVNNANVNFYSFNVNQRERRTKSYGMYGETTFYIGKKFNSVSPAAEYFTGNFPEYIAFPFELTANEKKRVESYLALKYGITLSSNTPYLNSKNITFWNIPNYIKFGSRIFGIGRDDISGLNQLQSESVHNKDYLVSSVGPLRTSNPIKQQEVSIENNHFIVFGDNGLSDGLLAPNPAQVRTLRRKWLSQNTGDKSQDILMNFKLKLAGVLNQALNSDPHLKLWMLHDKYVNNQNISDFSSQYVDYYETSSMDALNYGYFSKISFDPDKAIFDQFTFGVGPSMIVQLQHVLGDCDDNNIKSNVVITGGRAPYQINISNTGGYNENFTTNDDTLPFIAVAPNTYTIVVTDATGYVSQVTVDVVEQQVAVNLGANIVLNATSQQATLNAGQNVSDPTATYQWFQDGVQLQEIGPVLIVNEPGIYEVVVTSGNRMCQEHDKITVLYSFTGYSHPATDCGDELASATLGLTGGVAPYIVTFSGDAETYSQVFNIDTFTVTGLVFGNYDIMVTDNVGNVFTAYVELPEPLGGIAPAVVEQLDQNCGSSYDLLGYPYPAYTCLEIPTVVLDASINVTNPNVSYKWYRDNVDMNINGPLAEVVQDSDLIYDSNYPGSYTYTVKITNEETGCSIEEKFILIRTYIVQPTDQPIIPFKMAQQTQESSYKITAKVYPNPSAANSEFYYQLSSDEAIDGTVEIYSPDGKVIFSKPISGASSYKLPFSLITSGVYLIVTRTEKTTLTNKIIIK